MARFAVSNILALAVLAELGAAGHAQPPKYWIKVKPNVTGPFRVNAALETNIPGTVTLSVNLGLRGQRGSETFIGTEGVRLHITNGKAQTVIDGTKGVLPMGARLPKGTYDVEASFSPFWDENRAAAKKLGIKDAVTGTAIVKLGASGVSTQAAKKKIALRKWVMEHVVMDMPWKPELWLDKFGPWQELPLKGDRLNPRIVKAFYFKSIDMTILVNVLKREIIVWRDGAAHE